MNKYSRAVHTIAAITVLVALLLPGCSKDSSTGPGGPAPTTSLQANGALTNITRSQIQGTVFVADQSGNAITGLTAQDFNVRLMWGTGLPKITADSVIGSVVISTLSQSGKKIAAGMTMDYSGSMYTGATDPVTFKYVRIMQMETAVKSFIQAMGTADIAEIMKFDDVIHVVQPFTNSKSLLTAAVDSSLSLDGNTALYSSIDQELFDVSAQSASVYSRAVIAFTDGGENSSSISRDSLIGHAVHLGIPVYTVGLLDSSLHTTPPGIYNSGLYNGGPEWDLVNIADTTGGLYFYAPTAAQLAQIYSGISGQMNNALVMTINWPLTGLPPAGTAVVAYIKVTYNGVSTTFKRPYTIP